MVPHRLGRAMSTLLTCIVEARLAEKVLDVVVVARGDKVFFEAFLVAAGVVAGRVRAGPGDVVVAGVAPKKE